MSAISFTSHSLTVPRTARVLMAGATANSRTVLVALHGYAQRAEEMISSLLTLCDASPTLCVIAPEALSRFYRRGATGEEIGASWMTRADREQEIDDYLGYLDTVAAEMIRPDARLVVLGFSQGGATAARWAHHRAGSSPSVAQLVAWGSLLPPEITASPAEAALLPPTTFVHGTSDPLVRRDRIETEYRDLEAAGIPVQLIEHNGGHEITAGALEKIAVLLKNP